MAVTGFGLEPMQLKVESKPPSAIVPARFRRMCDSCLAKST